MKNKIKYITIILLLFSIIYFFINSNNSEKNINLETSIFKIIEKEKINLDTVNSKLKNYNYKNIKNTKQVWYGFFINNSWNFLTNKHIFNNNSKQYYIKINNINYSFNIIKKYDNKDLILWKIKNYKNNSFLKTDKFKKIKLGTIVFTIINKEKKYWKIILLNKKLINLKLSNLIETNIKLNPGDSWSPLFNKDWIVIGINTAIDEIKNTSFSERIN